MPNSPAQRQVARRIKASVPADPGVMLARAALVGAVDDVAGIYSNFASIGQSTHELVIDFAVLASSGDRELLQEWGPKKIYPAIPVARVRVPFDVAEGLIKALTTQLEKARSGELFKQVPDEELPT